MIILSFICMIFLLLFEQLTGTNAFECMHKSYDDDKFPDIHVQQCTGSCYSYWRYDPADLFNASLFQLISSGCSDSNDLSIGDCDPGPQCISSFNSLDFSNHTSYCCCSGDMCNIEFSIEFINELLDDSSGDVLSEDYSYTIFLVFVCLLLLIFSIISAKLVKSIITNKMLTNHKTSDSLHLLESRPTGLIATADARNLTGEECKDGLILIEQIGRGKYGPIWKGKLLDTVVFIKACRDSNEHLWKNESIIYSFPLMTHPNLPNFYGSIDRKPGNGNIEHYLVIEYGHQGSLKCFLNEHTFDWLGMFLLLKSLVQGLSYLHTEIGIEDKIKPSIAHCDLCSSNIIVKADGTCMICDFQHAVDLTNNPGLNTIERSNNVRYWAPEILDETINNLNSESTLKQADVYALGLILWEIATRCSDLYQGIDLPVFELPFQHEAGLHPTLDQMKLLVNRYKARPLFPVIWKDSNPAIRLLKETINECWDHEPEARLTALCIQERIRELPSLWKRHKMESLSSCHMLAFFRERSTAKQSTIGVADKGAIESPENHKANKVKNTNHVYSNVCYINDFENSLHCKYNDRQHLLHPPQHKHYFHHLSLNNANNNSNNPAKKQHLNVEKNFHMNSNKSTNIDNQQQGQPKLTLPLQPYHARNPCMERNLMIDDDSEGRGEILEQGLKFKNPNSKPSSAAAAETDPIDPNDMRNAQVNYSENRPLLPAPAPIPFVHNYARNIDNGESNASLTSIKIKDVNTHRKTDVVQCRRNSIWNFLKKKFLLGVFKSKPNDETAYLYCCDESNGRDMSVQSEDSLSSGNDTKSTGLDSNPSSKMISTSDNYQFSAKENLNNKQDSIVDAKTSDKLNNSSLAAAAGEPLKQDNIATAMSLTKKETELITTTDNKESQQPRTTTTC